jgi:superfamily II RNA helicase
MLIQPAPLTLGERLPAVPPDAEAALSTLLDWAAETGVTLYPHQEEAFLELAQGHHVILATPTGSGKSLVALALHFMGAAVGDRSYYTSPIKALVSEKFFALCAELGAERVGLMTGDGTVNRDATVICCTAEVLAQIALQEGEDADVQQVVMDEFHYYADRDRGMAWQIPLLTLPKTRFLLMSATLGDTSVIEADLVKRTGKMVKAVTSTHRPVPLTFEYRETPLQETVEELVKTGRAPLYLVHGSQRDAAETAQDLTSLDVCSKDHKKLLAEMLQVERFDSPFGKTLQRLLKHGIGLHHAGLLPKYRLLVEKLAQKGMLKLISGTDTLGVGINVPLRTVVLTKLCKFDGEQTRLYSVREFQQIAGRAGRKGFDDEGWVVAQAPEHVIQNRRNEAKLDKNGKTKSFVRAKPPEKGYVPWNHETLDRLVTGRPEALQSVFRVEPGMLMTLVKQPGGVAKMAWLIGQSHERPAVQYQHRRELAQHFRALRRAGVIEVRRKEDARGSMAVAATHLQKDFSLHHTLSLWLVGALDELAKAHVDQAMAPEAFAYDAVSLVEAILENPMPILIRQVSQEKTRVIQDLKAQGVPYEERLELLQEVTWPKPLAEWIYTSFNDFVARHPWVSVESVRPKSIAREMAEKWCTFDDYVRDTELEPVEGVLLRHLTQVYKTLVQNVPDDLKTEELLAIIGFLRATLARVDSSLLEEWEKLRGGDVVHAQVLPEMPERPKVPGLDVRVHEAELRATALELVRLLSEREWDAAAGMLRADPDEEAWTAARVEGLVQTWEAENGALVWDHKLRMKSHGAVRKVGEGWEVTQTVVGAREDGMLTLRMAEGTLGFELG